MESTRVYTACIIRMLKLFWIYNESIVDLHETSQNVVYVFDWFDSLSLGQHFFSYDGTGPPGLNTY